MRLDSRASSVAYRGSSNGDAIARATSTLVVADGPRLRVGQCGAGIAVLSTRTFSAFVREYSPHWGAVGLVPVSVWCHRDCKTSVSPPKRHHSATVVGSRSAQIRAENGVLEASKSVGEADSLPYKQVLENRVFCQAQLFPGR